MCVIVLDETPFHSPTYHVTLLSNTQTFALHLSLKNLLQLISDIKHISDENLIKTLMKTSQRFHRGNIQ